MLLFLAFLFSFLCYYFAKRRISHLVNHYQKKARSLPEYYGLNLAAWNFFASICIIIINSILKHFSIINNDTCGYIAIITLFIVILTYIFAALKTKFRAQLYFESTIKVILNTAAYISVFLTCGIILTILFQAIHFFNLVPIEDFLLGLKWSPQSVDHTNQTAFGVIPVLSGTLLITFIAMLVAIPMGLFSAIYIAEYTNNSVRNVIKPILELLAGIPTVVYGYFAALTMGPFIRNIGEFFGLNVSTESALSAGIVMGIMIIPFILSFSEDAIFSVPQNLRDAALALGSTKAEMITKVILPAAYPGIMSAILLAFSRAIGETMIVTMAAGLSAKLTFNPFDSVSTFTAQIVTLLTGDQEFDSPKTLAAFALALALFIITLFINILAIISTKRQTKYD